MVRYQQQKEEVIQPGEEGYVDFRLRRKIELELERTNGDVAKAAVAFENAQRIDRLFHEQALALRERTIVATVAHIQKLSEMRALAVKKVDRGELSDDALEMFDALYEVSKHMSFQLTNATSVAFAARRGLG